ncbi:hypothetical protein BDW59DRAFT_155054 [Aspergillus cavernicola]|uniref:Uncharacterized protein n=1 Tax=Aspergillus cavernicola TaxID=176166 RepID=A0ABR4HDR9_9EURO
MLDGALQLILIMDFIIDWARDVYRQDVLLHLAAIAKDKPCDQVTIDGDSDIFSSRLPQSIERWIPAPPSTIGAFLADADHSTVVPSEQKPNDKYMVEVASESWRDHAMGAMRLVTDVRYVFSCCYLTEQTVPVFIEDKTKRHRNKQKASEQAARQIIKFILQFDEVLLLKSADVGKLEKAWTSFNRADSVRPMSESSGEDNEFFVMLEVANYLSCEWEIVREMSCLAISQGGFQALASYANFARSVNKPFQLLAKRYCSWPVLRRCVLCLQSGSPWQIMLSAISSILMTLYPLPAHDGNYPPAATNLAFAYIHMPRLKPFLSKLFVATTWDPLKTLGERLRADQRYRIRQGEIPPLASDQDPREDPSKFACFERWSLKEKDLRRLDNIHSHNRCDRCRQVGEAATCPQNHGLVDQRRSAEETPPRLILVCSSAAPEGELPMPFNPGHQLQVACLFVFDPSEIFNREVHLSSLLTDFVQAGSVYHTIRHPLYPSYEDHGRGDDVRNLHSYVSWNLPLPYRPITKEEHLDLMTWITEVDGNLQHTPLYRKTQAIMIQPILHCLRAGLSYDQITPLLVDSNQFRHIEKTIDAQYKALLACNTYKTSIKKKKFKLAGDEVITIFTNWDDGGQHLARLRARSRRETASATESPREAEPNEVLAGEVDTVMVDLT